MTWYLEALNVCGDVASGLMLRRRSTVFVRSGLAVPVVRLLFQSVPGIVSCVGDE